MYSKKDYYEKTKTLINIFAYSEVSNFQLELSRPTIFTYRLTDVS